MFINKFAMISILFSITIGVNFEWIEFDDSYDFVVGISVDNQSVGIGSFITWRHILTSANPLQPYMAKAQWYRIKVHAINETFQDNGIYDVNCLTTTYIDLRANYWIPHGFDGVNSPIHDIVTITLDGNVARPWGMQGNRLPFYVPVAQHDTYLFGNLWKYAGFGYIDEQHVTEMYQLEKEDYKKTLQVDCDELFPREWGLFICLENIDNLGAIQSGAPLYQRGRLVGLGCFGIQRGQESFFVFTDIGKYSKQIGYCIDGHYKIFGRNYVWFNPRVKESLLKANRSVYFEMEFP